MENQAIPDKEEWGDLLAPVDEVRAPRVIKLNDMSCFYHLGKYAKSDRHVIKHALLVCLMFGMNEETALEKAKTYVGLTSPTRYAGIKETTLNDAHAFLSEFNGKIEEKEINCVNLQMQKYARDVRLREECCKYCPMSRNYIGAHQGIEKSFLRYMISAPLETEWRIIYKPEWFRYTKILGPKHDHTRYPIIKPYAEIAEYVYKNLDTFTAIRHAANPAETKKQMIKDFYTSCLGAAYAKTENVPDTTNIENEARHFVEILCKEPVRPYEDIMHDVPRLFEENTYIPSVPTKNKQKEYAEESLRKQGNETALPKTKSNLLSLKTVEGTANARAVVADFPKKGSHSAEDRCITYRGNAYDADTQMTIPAIATRELPAEPIIHDEINTRKKEDNAGVPEDVRTDNASFISPKSDAVTEDRNKIPTEKSHCPALSRPTSEPEITEPNTPGGEPVVPGTRAFMEKTLNKIRSTPRISLGELTFEEVMEICELPGSYAYAERHQAEDEPDPSDNPKAGGNNTDREEPCADDVNDIEPVTVCKKQSTSSEKQAPPAGETDACADDIARIMQNSLPDMPNIEDTGTSDVRHTPILSGYDAVCRHDIWLSDLQNNCSEADPGYAPYTPDTLYKDFDTPVEENTFPLITAEDLIPEEVLSEEVSRIIDEIPIPCSYEDQTGIPDVNEEHEALPCTDIDNPLEIPYVSGFFNPLILRTDDSVIYMTELIEDAAKSGHVAIEYVRKGFVYGLLMFTGNKFYFLDAARGHARVMTALCEKTVGGTFISLNPVPVHAALLKFGIPYQKITSLSVKYALSTGITGPVGVDTMFCDFLYKGKLLNTRDTLLQIMPKYALLDAALTNNPETSAFLTFAGKYEYALSRSMDLSAFTANRRRYSFGGNFYTAFLGFTEEDLRCSIKKDGVLFSVELNLSFHPMGDDAAFWKDVAGTVAMSLKKWEHAYLIGISPSNIMYYVCSDADLFYDKLMAAVRICSKHRAISSGIKNPTINGNVDTQTPVVDIRVHITAFGNKALKKSREEAIRKKEEERIRAEEYLKTLSDDLAGEVSEVLDNGKTHENTPECSSEIPPEHCDISHDGGLENSTQTPSDDNALCVTRENPQNAPDKAPDAPNTYKLATDADNALNGPIKSEITQGNQSSPDKIRNDSRNMTEKEGADKDRVAVFIQGPCRKANNIPDEKSGNNTCNSSDTNTDTTGRTITNVARNTDSAKTTDETTKKRRRKKRTPNPNECYFDEV